ncbi:MAG: hypothetical protein U0Q18_08170 [Bryobacteraceae bacterium]
MDCGSEIRLYDPLRNPRDWTDLIHSSQCAAFFKDRVTSAPRTAEGRPFPDNSKTTCLIFDHLDQAQRFCRDKVEAQPGLRCEIYDAEGLAHPPLLVIVHPGRQDQEDTSSRSSRKRRLVATVLVLASGPLIWVDMRRNFTLVLPTFLALNCIVAGLRFVYWEFATRHREQERRKRLDAHLEMERRP